MRELKLIKEYKDFLDMREAADHYGIAFEDACRDAINMFLEEESRSLAAEAKMKTAEGKKEYFEKLAAAHTQQKEMQGQSGSHNVETNVTAFPTVQAGEGQ